MVPLHSPKEYLFNLYTTRPGDSKRMWRNDIKESWNHKCAYCDSEDNLTIDHIVPQCNGGLDIKTNVIACCHSCNQSKGHEHWKLWYVQQDFYSENKFNKIEDWMKPEPPTNLYAYRPRKNNAS
jgi:5-methylcytosine-specific restriction endonuclease McrA